jgi:catechol 2,3-dioxygenase-like lactoylglutathione lyase family enzyme
MQTVYPQIKNMSPLFVVVNLEQSIDFYTQKLGFEIDFRYEDFYAGIARDGFSIHLKSGYAANEEKASRRDSEHVDITFSVSDIHSLFEAIKSMQVTIVQPLRQMPYGSEFYIADPDWYILSFLE